MPAILTTCAAQRCLNIKGLTNQTPWSDLIQHPELRHTHPGAPCGGSSDAEPQQAPLLLPALFFKVSKPCLWKTSDSLQQLVRQLLLVAFCWLRYEVQAVGYKLAVAAHSSWQHKVDLSNRHWRSSLSSSELLELKQEAAVLLFQQPPVRQRMDHLGVTQQQDCCMTVRASKLPAEFKHWLVMKAGYPYLVLQQKSKGHPEVKVKLADFIAHITHHQVRDGEGKLVLCHYDVQHPSNPQLDWKTAAADEDSWLPGFEQQHAMPATNRCFSRGCCNPVCLLYASQSYNAKTGRHRLQLAGKKAKRMLFIRSRVRT